MKKKVKLKDFKIETTDGGGCMIFLTSAEDHKKALRCLQTHSWDYKHLCNNRGGDLIIKVTELEK
jgi:hypothetical protein